LNKSAPRAVAPRWPRADAGFTLLELAIVLFLLGLFSSLVIPLFGGLGGDALKTTARRLAGTTKYLYNEAALNGRPYRLVFDLDAGTYSGRRLETSGELVELTGSGGEHSLPGGIRFRDVVVAGRGLTSSGTTYAAILPVGWIDETVIHLADSGGHVLTVRLLPLTGTSEVYEGYREFENLAASQRPPGR
jgi:general secretion pathway protein H